jgi:hypothetical protein
LFPKPCVYLRSENTTTAQRHHLEESLTVSISIQNLKFDVFGTERETLHKSLSKSFLDCTTFRVLIRWLNRRQVHMTNYWCRLYFCALVHNSFRVLHRCKWEILGHVHAHIRLTALHGTASQSVLSIMACHS